MQKLQKLYHVAENWINLQNVLIQQMNYYNDELSSALKVGDVGWVLSWIWSIRDWQIHYFEMFAIEWNESKNLDLTEKSPTGQIAQIQF